MDGTKTVFPNPVLVFEVLSPSTARVDLGRKRAEYAQLASVHAYLLVESDRIAAIVLARDPGGAWTETAVDAGGKVDLPAITVRLNPADAYEDVRF